ncbi:MAG: hypothetical protein ACP5RT_00700 [Candidatus Micrarchaeia archaeon]
MINYPKKARLKFKRRKPGTLKSKAKISKNKVKSKVAARKIKNKPKAVRNSLTNKKNSGKTNGIVIEKFSNRKNIEEIVNNQEISTYIAKNVGKKAIDLINMLDFPTSDEELAEKSDIKINEVRRILNVLNSYGLTKYDTLKDKNGWLTFKWYINMNNIENVKKNLEEKSKSVTYKLPDGCNDFFICGACFDKRRILLPFDTAVEMKFKCDCGGDLQRISKEEAKKLLDNNEFIE